MKKFFPTLSILAYTLSPSYGNFYPDELRFGAFKNDVRGIDFHYHHERGVNANFEVLFPALTGGVWEYIFRPKVHVGTSINLKGYTSHLYTGFTWIIPLCRFVIEPTFGIGLNNSARHKGHRRQRLGSPITFRESISFGFRVTDHWTAYFMLDHVSHAGIFGPNPGISTIGGRIGYKF